MLLGKAILGNMQCCLSEEGEGVIFFASTRTLADLTICLNPACPLGPDRYISQDDPDGVMEMSGRGSWLGKKYTWCYFYSLENPDRRLG